MKGVASLLLCGLLFIECGASSEQFKQASSQMLKQVIIVGSTTQEDLKKQFGRPDSEEINGEKKTWIYENVSFTNIKNTSLLIEFDKNSFVEDYILVS